jgi:hypothetical protein
MVLPGEAMPRMICRWDVIPVGWRRRNAAKGSSLVIADMMGVLRCCVDFVSHLEHKDF